MEVYIYSLLLLLLVPSLSPCLSSVNCLESLWFSSVYQSRTAELDKPNQYVQRRPSAKRKGAADRVVFTL